MKNLEQIRAAAALPAAAATDLSRSAVNKLPALIMQSGLLATGAFCDAEGGGKNREDMKKALEATAEHLAQRSLLATGTKTLKAMIDDLSKRDSRQLQAATSEALAFIAYLKRFAPKD